MTKENIEKISIPSTALDVKDMTPDEKKHLSSFLLEKGFTSPTFYLRFFQKGFSLWEIMGTRECKRQFLAIPETAEVLKSHETAPDTDNDGEGKSLYDMACSDEPGVFYACLKKEKGLCTRFFRFMQDKGMCMGVTIKRFSSDDWKPWEQEGITSLLREYMSK